MNFNLNRQFNFCRAPQTLAQDFLLDIKLMLVAGVLIVASAARAKVWALRLNPVRGRFGNRFGPCPDKPGLPLCDDGLDGFASQHERNKRSLAASTRVRRQARKAVAAVDQLFDIKKQGLILNASLERSASGKT